MNSSKCKFYAWALLFGVVSGCSPTKDLQEGEVYLKANKIEISPKIIEPDNIYPYIKQRENTRALWLFKLKMQQYLAVKDVDREAKNEKKRAKWEGKNAKRVEKGKEAKEFKPVLYTRLKNSGEPPVIFDTTLVNLTIVQFEKALFNRGYFRNEVYTELKYNSDSSKVIVSYLTHEGPQYTLDKISMVLEDPALKDVVKLANKGSLLHKGNPYNTDVIDAERERFSSEMRNNGYYFFSKEYITFTVDSTVGNYQVNMQMVVKNPTGTGTENDSLASRHRQYKVGRITINTDYSAKYGNPPEDTLTYENLIFSNISTMQYNPVAFPEKLFFSTGELYSEKAQSRTYTRLSGLNNFKYINISYSQPQKDTNVLDCSIMMTPFPKQSFGVEVEGTNTAGNLGISGYVSYNNRNIFRKAENFRIRLKGGVEAQRTNSASAEVNEGIFNTIEYGVETSLIFQNLLLPSGWRAKILREFNQPKTSLNLIYNYQNRPDFERFLVNTSLGYSFVNRKVNTNEFFIYPVDINFIRIEKSPEFTQRLEDLNNPLLDATYDNQFILGTRVLENWTNKRNSRQKNYLLNQALFESAGNLLQVVNNGFAEKDPPDDNGESYYTISGVRYAQFVRFQNDLSQNTRINRSQSMAYRFLGGLGIPYGNARSLPYDRSFYGGGANDNRGWRARSLGPGSMIDSLKVGVDQVADIKLQISAEYRFTVFKSIEGAFFADAGNIWLLREDEARPGANIDLSRFYKEVALSSGVGLRFNFGFLLIRLDWGFKILDPNLPEGERFVLAPPEGGYLDNYSKYSQGRTYSYSVLNLGIGYPF